MKIEIRLNGETHELPAPLSIRQLLEHFDLPKERVAVERNRAIVPKPQWEKVAVAQGDELEVVHLVGGGSHHERSECEPARAKPGINERSECEPARAKPGINERSECEPARAKPG